MTSLTLSPPDDYVKLTVAEPQRVDKQFGDIMELTLHCSNNDCVCKHFWPEYRIFQSMFQQDEKCDRLAAIHSFECEWTNHNNLQ